MIDRLLEDYAFGLLLKDFLKVARKGDSPQFRESLSALVKRINELQGGVKMPPPLPEADPDGQDAPATKEDKARIDAENKANRNSKAADDLEYCLGVCKKAFAEIPFDSTGRMTVRIHKERAVSGLESACKAAGLAFSELQVGLYPVAPGVEPDSWLLTFSR